MAREIEYLEEALQEAEVAARWYAERGAAAAVAFTEEIDAAESAILQFPDAWPRHNTRAISFGVFHSVSFTELSRSHSDSSGRARASSASLLEIATVGSCRGSQIRRAGSVG